MSSTSSTVTIPPDFFQKLDAKQKDIFDHFKHKKDFLAYTFFRHFLPTLFSWQDFFHGYKQIILNGQANKIIHKDAFAYFWRLLKIY